MNDKNYQLYIVRSRDLGAYHPLQVLPTLSPNRAHRIFALALCSDLISVGNRKSYPVVCVSLEGNGTEQQSYPFLVSNVHQKIVDVLGDILGDAPDVLGGDETSLAHGEGLESSSQVFVMNSGRAQPPNSKLPARHARSITPSGV